MQHNLKDGYRGLPDSYTAVQRRAVSVATNHIPDRAGIGYQVQRPEYFNPSLGQYRCHIQRDIIIIIM